MKFDMHKFWKHDHCTDSFFKIRSVAFDDNGKNAILHGWWCTQFVSGWCFGKDDRIMVDPKQYEKWKHYEPKGKLFL